MKNAADKNFEEYFDNGGSVMPFADMKHAVKPNSPTHLYIELPVWMVEALEQKAQDQKITKQSLIKMWLSEIFAVKTKITSM